MVSLRSPEVKESDVFKNETLLKSIDLMGKRQMRLIPPPRKVLCSVCDICMFSCFGSLGLSFTGI